MRASSASPGPGEPPRPSGRGVLLLVGLAAALRVYPLHVFFLHPDQEWIPSMAMRSILEHSWRPEILTYPSALMETLRVFYLGVYVAGRALGAFADRVDLAAAAVSHPLAFLLAGRLWSCLLGIATVPVIVWLGACLHGRRAGLLGGLVLAVAFLHVRESHYGTLDVPAAACFAAALLAAERHRARGDGRALVVAAALTGAAVAHRYQLAVAGLSLGTAVALRGGARSTLSRRTLVATMVGVGVFAVLSPYTLLEPARAWHDVSAQLRGSFGSTAIPSAGLGTLWSAAVGLPVCALALAGVVASLRAAPAATAVVLAAGLPYLAALAMAERVFARYLVPVVPLAALFAGVGLDAALGLLPGRIVRVAGVLLVVGAIADPFGRSLALDRLLARPDTRVLAGRWLAGHVERGEPVLFAASPYANPLAPGTAEWERVSPALVARLDARGLPRIRPVYRDGSPPVRYAVTAGHPVLQPWVLTLPETRALVAARGRAVATFEGVAAQPGLLYELPDGNFVPLRGLTRVTRPGPNLTIWGLGPEVASAASLAGQGTGGGP